MWDTGTRMPLGPPLDVVARHCALSADGRHVLASTGEVTWLWSLPPPVPGVPENVRLWAEVNTGLTLGEDDVIQVLDAAAWQERRGRLR